MFSNQLRNDSSTDDTSTSMLSFLNMASATIKVTLGKPRGCRRKVNLRRHLQKHFLRLSGRKVASHRLAMTVEKRRKSASSLAITKRSPKTRLSCSNQTRQRQDVKPLEREPAAPPSPDTLGVPSPTGSCALSLPGTEKELFLEKSTGCLQHLPFRSMWSDDEARSPTCSSLSDGCDYPFSPSPACTPLRDDLSMSGESVFSLPSSPMGVNQTARLLSNRWSSEGAEYPPRLHHLDPADILAFSNQAYCACPPHNPALAKQPSQHQPAVNSFADYSTVGTPSTPTCALPWQSQASTFNNRDLPLPHTYQPSFQSAHQTTAAAMMDSRQYCAMPSYNMKAGWQTVTPSYSCGPTSAYSLPPPPPRSAKETCWSF